MKRDDLIDQLIRPPVDKNPEGFTGWSQTHKLAPNGAAAREKIVSTRLQPVPAQDR